MKRVGPMQNRPVRTIGVLSNLCCATNPSLDSHFYSITAFGLQSRTDWSTTMLSNLAHGFSTNTFVQVSRLPTFMVLHLHLPC